MKTVLLSVGVSSLIFWGIIAVAFVFNRMEQKKHPLSSGHEVKDKYGDVCAVCNLLSGFVMFAVCSAGIAVLTEHFILSVVLHAVTWYLSGICMERFFPHINNRLVALFIRPDN